MEQRERLGSRIGFILLSAGCAIGCGNVWKFPWMCGQCGGGGFVAIYFVFLLILGLPVLTMEFAIGRKAQASPLTMYQKIEKPGQKWHIHGYASLVGNFCLMAFYTVVCGWICYYFVKFLTGENENFGFAQMIHTPSINVIYLLITVVIAFTVLCFNLQGGLERITKYMMTVLIVLMAVLVVHSASLQGAGEGLSFYLVPDFSKIDGSVVVGAMNQAFFTISVGIGSMAIFGSYIDKERSLLGESVNIVLLDTAVAIMAGLIIFPACFTYDVEVTSGPSLLFDTMAMVFNNMNGGRLWGTIFFMFMMFAALSTVLAVCENILSMVRDITGFNRPKGCLLCGIILFCLALTTALGFSVLSFHPFGAESSWLDFWDFIVSSNLLPLGSLVFALFCCNGFGWGWDNFVLEANEGRGLKIKPWMKPIFRFVVPAAVVFIWIYGLVTFNWG